MRILWHGIGCDKPTGYGKQTDLFTRALVRAGHSVRINAAMDRYCSAVDRNGIYNFACGPKDNMLGNDFLLGHCEQFRPEVVLSCIDTFVCVPDRFSKLPWYPFVMVDSEPLLWENREVLKACRRPIAPTWHADRVLSDAGFKPLYCPLAIDTTVYKPVSETERTAVRQRIGAALGVDLTRRFLVVMVAANMSQPSRKNFGAAIKAWAEFASQHDDVLFYIHTDKRGLACGGEDLERVVSVYGAKHIAFANYYDYLCGNISEAWMAELYNAADLLLHTSRGEGFGLPLAEAQACGCPVCVPDFGSMAEVAQHPLSRVVTQGMRWMYHTATEQFLVDPVAVSAELRWYYDMWHRGRLGVERAAACTEYDIEQVCKTWMEPLLRTVAQAESERVRIPPVRALPWTYDTGQPFELYDFPELGNQTAGERIGQQQRPVAPAV